MTDEVLFNHLEELAEKLGISVRDEHINSEESSGAGGLCRVEGKHILILNSRATVKEKNRVMIEALGQFDLSDVYIKPMIRDLLEGQRDAGDSQGGGRRTHIQGMSPDVHGRKRR